LQVLRCRAHLSINFYELRQRGRKGKQRSFRWVFCSSRLFCLPSKYWPGLGQPGGEFPGFDLTPFF
jgi:hypothetical protein